jgi:hypothetical protein
VWWRRRKEGPGSHEKNLQEKEPLLKKRYYHLESVVFCNGIREHVGYTFAVMIHDAVSVVGE